MADRINVLLLSGPVALVFALAGCKRPASGASSPAAPASPAAVPVAAPVDAGVERAKEEAFTVELESATASFRLREIAEAMGKLEKVPAEFHGDPEFLTLRGSCHVENRDFDAALKDFQEAAKLVPGEPSVRFNMGEVYFVTKRWDEAVKEFQRVKPTPGADAEGVNALVAFKLMLCEEGRGNGAEFGRLAAENLKEADTLLAAYTQAAMEFRDGKKAEAKDTLAEAGRRFPTSSDRAPWHDTMIEFGYDPR